MDTPSHPRLEAVRARVKSLNLADKRALARYCGASERWVYKFTSGFTRDPGARKYLHMVEWIDANFG